MNNPNPYSAPESNVAPSSEKQLSDLDFKEIKKLHHSSRNVNAINILLSIGLVFMAIAALFPEMGDPTLRAIFIGLAVFYAIAVIGIYKRTPWGRVLGIIACTISLINIPIGTIIGGFGLYAFISAPQLFGKNRITHKEIKAELKRQKAIQKG